ncbi:hypothetical protein [Comamonas testosteroni]|uniref:hypothetical protein n=1 Tax=Comamonas testosteroni TaxID=285 RepID=UPI0005B462FE|nr:hypothetical protein [Comamonas testosteroni]
MNQYRQGQKVRLVPTQGGHQQERTGEVTRVTAKQVDVRPTDGKGEIRFHSESGMPVRKIDQQFPCYKLYPLELSTDNQP